MCNLYYGHKPYIFSRLPLESRDTVARAPLRFKLRVEEVADYRVPSIEVVSVFRSLCVFLFSCF